MPRAESPHTAPEAVQIRRIEAGDYPRVSEIICRCLREVNIKDYGEEHIDRMLPTFAAENLPRWFESAETYVLVAAGSLVGTATLRGNAIQTVFIDPDRRGQGFGKQLMAHLEQRARAQGFSEASLKSSLTSRSFYEAIGYVPASEVHGAVGGKMIAMNKRL